MSDVGFGEIKYRWKGLDERFPMVSIVDTFREISCEIWPENQIQVVSVTLENFERHKTSTQSHDQQEPQTRWVNEVLKNEGHVSPPNSMALSRVPSWKSLVNEKGDLNLTVEEAKDPKIWSRICLHNMAKIAKEATTVRRVLESLFRYFGNGNLWSPQHGLALPVLLDMQLLMEKTGQNTHLMLSILIKHLDQKSVIKQPDMQISVVEVTTVLAHHSKIQPSVAIIGAINDLMRHLRKSMHCSLESANLGDDIVKWNINMRSAIDGCLVQLCSKVGDSGPVLDMMAVVLENIPTTVVVARTTISAVYRIAQIIASVPNLSYQNKAFPEALFHQLLLAMVYPDHETRIWAHRIFSVVLVPSAVCPSPSKTSPDSSKANDLGRTLSRTVSVFSSSAALFGKLRKEKFSFREGVSQDTMPKLVNLDDEAKEKSRILDVHESQKKNDNDVKINTLQSSRTRAFSIKGSVSSSVAYGKSLGNPYKEQEPISLRLSSHQITVLLSSIWAQATSPENTPKNYESIAHTYSLLLLFSRAKTSNHETLIRSFQLAFSLRKTSLEGGPLQPSRRRSLFSLAISMFVFAAKAYNIQPLILCVKASLTDKTVDPFLHLVEDCRLQALDSASDHQMRVYGSKDDDTSALKSLSAITISENQSKESLASMIVKSMRDLSDSESSTIKQQLLNEFMPDDVCPLGAQLFTEMPSSKEIQALDEITSSAFSVDDDAFPEPSEGQGDSKVQLSEVTPNLLSVHQLLESVLETAGQVGRFSVCEPDVPYKEMASHCEALLMGKQQKMSAFVSTYKQQENLPNCSSQGCEVKPPSYSLMDQDIQQECTSGQVMPPSYSLMDQGYQQSRNPFIEQKFTTNQYNPYNGQVSVCSTAYQNPFFRLPAASPYDNFLKAAGC